VLAFLGACSAPQVRDAQPGVRAAADTDEAGLRYQMDQFERRLQNSALLERDPALNAYLRDLTCRLATDLCSDIRLYVVDQPTFNASMSPNGMLVVYTGVLLRASDEAQVAFVLGHEIGHYREQHMLERWRSIKRSENAMLAFQILTAGAGIGLVGSVASLAGYARVMAFSRDQERAADLAGFNSLTQAGYDAASAADLWRHLLAEEQANRKGDVSSIFASHPASKERLQSLAEQAAQRSDGGTRGRERLLAVTAPLRERWLSSELGRRNDAQTLVLLTRLRAEAAPGTQGGLIAAQAEVRRRSGDIDAAQALYLEAIAHADVPATAHRDLGLLYRSRGDVAGARTQLALYLERRPDASDRAMVIHYLDRLNATPEVR
jgi:predicted Zn-dependent protease